MSFTSPSNLNFVSGFDASDYALRGLTQSLDPIDAKIQARRTVNGTLVDVSNSAFQKYKSIVTVPDQLPPALDGVWPGDTIVVDCACELSYVTATGTAGRTVVAGSSRTEGAFTFYRPRISFIVRAVNVLTDEWGGRVTWTMELEEV